MRRGRRQEASVWRRTWLASGLVASLVLRAAIRRPTLQVTTIRSPSHAPFGQTCTQPRVSSITLPTHKTVYQCQIATPSHIFAQSAVRLDRDSLAAPSPPHSTPCVYFVAIVDSPPATPRRCVRPPPLVRRHSEHPPNVLLFQHSPHAPTVTHCVYGARGSLRTVPSAFVHAFRVPQGLRFIG